MDGALSPLVIRPGRDDDAAGFIALIGTCWAEYPGCVLDVDGEVPELRALASHYARKRGALWAAEQGGAIVGMVAVAPTGHDDAWEIARMYVGAEARGTGLAVRLLQGAERHAREHGAVRMVLWTDTRFERAHRFYQNQGYLKSGSIRLLDDLSKTLEFRYVKPLTGLVVEALDAQGAASAETALARILKACVDAGASVHYLPPLGPKRAREHFRKAASEVAEGKRMLLCAWFDGQIVGTVQLDLGTPPNQPHRGDVIRLLVDPEVRRRGIGRALITKVEQAARGVGRSLLTLHTAADDAGEALCRAAGWTEAGRIPGYAMGPGGALVDAVFFWKRVE